MPFGAGWAGETFFAAAPTAHYGVALLMCGFACWILRKAIVSEHGKESLLARALGRDLKGNGSIALYLIAIALAMTWPLISNRVYVFVALMWLIPDRRIDRLLRGTERKAEPGRKA